MMVNFLFRVLNLGILLCNNAGKCDKHLLCHSSLQCSFTKIFGYCPDEVNGKSAYSFLHKDDLKIVAEAHYKDLNNKSRSPPEIIYRFRAKAGHYVPLKSTSFAFRNPWSKEVDYVVTRSVVIRLVSYYYDMILVSLLYSNLLKTVPIKH